MPLDPNKLKVKCHNLSVNHTKFNTYLQMNPSLTFSENIYDNIHLPEHHRMAASRFRLSSHNLLIERLRWTRVPRHSRLCPCSQDKIQDEHHVFNDCEISQYLRVKTSLKLPKTLSEMFESDDINVICSYVYELLNWY